MKEKLLRFLRLISVSPKRFPVEFALGLTFFFVAAYNTAFSHWDSDIHSMVCNISGTALPFFIPLVVLSFWLGRVNKVAYYVSYLLFLPLMAVDLLKVTGEVGYVFMLFLSGLLLIVGTRRMDNRTFVYHALHVFTQTLLGLCIAGLLNLALFSVFASVFYIFDITTPNNFYSYISQFVWYVTAPQFCCTLISREDNMFNEPAKVLQFIFNYILTPALVIYAAIMYLYFAVIAVEWELPKGGIAWMVIVYLCLAGVGFLAQFILPKRHYDWFYGNLGWFAIPPIIMYWIGVIYRISQYSFTEERFYLLLAGVIMVLFVVMISFRKSCKLQLMAVILGVTIVVFTYIPWISAAHIGLVCQEKRMCNLMKELGVADSASGMFIDSVDVRRINADSSLCMRYRELSDVEHYVRYGMSEKDFQKEYGKWNYSTYNFNYLPDSISEPERDCERNFPLQLGEYTILLPDAYSLRFSDGVITIRTNESGDKVLEYPIEERVRQNPGCMNNPSELFTYSNDSLLLVLGGMNIAFREIRYVNDYGFSLYRKNADEPIYESEADSSMIIEKNDDSVSF